MQNLSNWMGQLLAKNAPVVNQPINTMLIPGTHESGSYGTDTRMRAQSLSIDEQLYNGVRYFDCRIMRNGDDFYFYHYFQSNNKFGTRNGDPQNNQDCVLYDIKQFLFNNPKEILILKFQDFDGFGTKDYTDFLNLIKNYFEFGDVPEQGKVQSPNCRIVKLATGSAIDIGQETLKSLNDKGMRVFLFFQVKDVPTDPTIAAEIWNYAFQYEPILSKGGYGLWDPYWGDKGSGISVKDTNDADMQAWWNWHELNRQAWLNSRDNAGLYALQSHMQELHGAGNSGGDLYFNIAEQVADANYYMNQDATTGDFESNNIRNIEHYIQQVKQGATYNIIAFDYIQHGDVCAAIVNYYNSTVPTPQPVTFQQHIVLKLNNLSLYIGRGLGDHQYVYPRLSGNSVALYILNAGNTVDNNVIHDKDQILIYTTEDNYDERNQLSVYQSKSLYYYTGSSNNEQWKIHKSPAGGPINTGDYVMFESVAYPGQYLTLGDEDYLTTKKMNKPTRWIINM